jgi:ABC-type branched-subunit amino acid transport system ATPase component
MMADASVEIRDVEVVFGGLRALKGVSLDARPGHITGLIGPNGAGKTTLFNVMTSVIRPHRGRVSIAGKDITNTPPHKIARQGVARTFQTPRGFPSLVVIDNVLIGPGDRNERLIPSLLGKKFPSRLRERALGILERVGLAAKAEDSYKNLSSGEARLLEVARHLIRQPQYLLLDEPTAGVAPELQHRLSTLLREIRDEGTTLICVEHNMKFLRGLADHVVVLDTGEVISSGEPDAVFADRRVIEAYLGQGRVVRAAD